MRHSTRSPAQYHFEWRVGEALYAQGRTKPRNQRTPETQTVHVCLLPTFSLTAISLRIYRPCASPLVARRWEALDAPRQITSAAGGAPRDDHPRKGASVACAREGGCHI